MGVTSSSLIGLPLILDTQLFEAAPIPLSIMDGGHCYFALDLKFQDFWTDVTYKLEADETITSAFDVLNVVRSSLVAKVKVRARPFRLFSLTIPETAPSTHDWVHGFALWTGISPPASARDADINVHRALRPIAMENDREFLCRQEDRGCCTSMRRTRRSRRNRQTRHPSDRHPSGSRNLRRDAFRRTRTDRENAWQQAA